MTTLNLTYAQCGETGNCRQPALGKACDLIQNIVIVEILK